LNDIPLILDIQRMNNVSRNGRIKVTICIATCKRNQYLTVLLDKIKLLHNPGNVLINVVVADNDPQKGAEQLIIEIKKHYPFQLVYGFEKNRGISFARNKAVSLAEKDTDFIVFIDDDEYPDADWLNKLLEAQSETNADLVQGPFVSIFDEDTPQWIIKGSFFKFAHYNLNTGDKLPDNAVATNNLLVRYNTLMLLEGPFDENMSLVGGEDTALGLNLGKLGCKMIFANKALVYEHVPESRTKLKWILQRIYRDGNTVWLLTLNKNIYTFLKILAGALVRIFFGVILLIPSLIISAFSSFHYFVKTVRLIVRGAGMIAGLLGKNYEEYKHAYTSQS
jgi:succinoglycan biosynthesis protein ExoM